MPHSLAEINILDARIDNVTMEEAIARASALLAGQTGGYIVTPNPEIIQAARKDPALQEILKRAVLALPDGIGVVYAARLLRRPLRGRVPGVEFGEAILPAAAKEGRRLYIYGGKPGVAEKAAARLGEKYPGLILCGTSDGYIQDDSAVCRSIADATPDLLYVCLGAPAQERWMAAHTEMFPHCLMFGLGGSVDIYSGEVKRAPKFWRTCNLEWFYRVLCQPKRIVRLLKSLPPFALAVLRQRRSEKKSAAK